MRRNSGNYSMIVELMAVILFFSLSSGVILSLFAGADRRAQESVRLSGAITAAAGAAETVRAAVEPRAAFTDAYGASFSDGGLEAPLDASFMPRFNDLPGEYIMRLECDETESLFDMKVLVLTYEGELIYSLDCANFRKGGAQ